MELSFARENVNIGHLGLHKEIIALVLTLTRRCVVQINALLMANFLNGQLGRNARNRARMEHNHITEHVILTAVLPKVKIVPVICMP